MGIPAQIISDNDTYSDMVEKGTTRKGIKVKYVMKYHPKSNPVVCYNQEKGRILRKYCAIQHTKWAQYLDNVEY